MANAEWPHPGKVVGLVGKQVFSSEYRAKAVSYVDPRIVGRDGPVEDVLANYRGCASLTSTRLQSLERAVLAQVGWSLFDRPRWGDDDERQARLHVRDLDGAVHLRQAYVDVARWSPVPQCGEPIVASTTVEPEWSVTGLAQVA